MPTDIQSDAMLWLHADYIFDAFDCFDFLDEGGELAVVADTDHKITLEHAVVGVDGDVAKHGVRLFRDDRGDVGYDADVVVAYYAQ